MEKDETHPVIRFVRKNDAQTILNIQRDVISEKNYFITTSDEFKSTLQEQEDEIQEIMENKRETLLVAEVNNEVVGWLKFHSSPLKRLSHVGTFGMMLLKDYRNVGLGKQLVSTMLNWAEQNHYIEKVSLGVFSTNDRAIELYKRMGFAVEGRKVNEIKLDENTYIDDILMYKMV
ncbi:GNAT family N-acetyltransferase [Lentibacillus sp. L22]|uniref:GNAT family N-acetyltransferase n=1 Tax=Lentibacillus TaxID=175304 RepID=UPI0022B11430|nr:GNAT family N-acetyltransferase [Lentibacillus daqui]